MKSQHFQPFDAGAPTHRFRLNLPHWQQADATYFVTFRLADSLPREAVQRWLDDRRVWLQARGLTSAEEVRKLPESEQRRFSKHFIGRIERTLDECAGECVLRSPKIAQLVATALGFFHNQRYWLHRAVVMPNHVHALVTPAEGQRLDQIIHSWKSFTAKEINRLTGREGQVWQAESYDHIVRNEDSLRALGEYIVANPEKAKLRAGEYVLISND